LDLKEEDWEEMIEVGLYSSEENADKAIERFQKKPDFNLSTDRLQVLTSTLDEDGYAGGFSTWQEALDALPD
jgi:hypothetical protein